jgi:hypothetical protein
MREAATLQCAQQRTFRRRRQRKYRSVRQSTPMPGQDDLNEADIGFGDIRAINVYISLLPHGRAYVRMCLCRRANALCARKSDYLRRRPLGHLAFSKLK